MSVDKYAVKLTKAVDYIEKNLKHGVSHADAAREAGMSPDNLWRVFKNTFGESIGSYIRARRITSIARGLTATKKKISGLAAEYGYESQEIFTRAFKKFFYMTPTGYRQNGKNLIFLERQRMTGRTIRHFLREGISLRPRIEKTGAFQICGVAGSISLKNSVADASGLVMRLIMNRKKMIKVKASEAYVFAGASDGTILSLSSKSRIDLLFGYPAGICPKGLAKKTVPAGTYAVFRHRGGADKLWVSYDYIFGNWIKRLPQKYMPGYIFERGSGDFVMGESLWIDIYVPVRGASKPR